MKHLPLFFVAFMGLITLTFSCKKEDNRVFTADFHNQFQTSIEINYEQGWNTTTIYAYFYKPDSWERLKLPKDSHIKVNGYELAFLQGDYYHGNFYFLRLPGKQNCTIEFKDIDGSTYQNTVILPDTAYFIDFPDTIVSASDTAIFKVNPPILDSNESNDIHLNYYGSIFKNYENFIAISPIFFHDESTHNLTFYRVKELLNPNLPAGGGNVVSNYITHGLFWTE